MLKSRIPLTISLNPIFLLAIISALSLFSCHKNPVAPSPIPAITLISPVGGEKFLLSQPVAVAWRVNPDSVGLPVVTSFTRVFSLDSGLNWLPMSYTPATARLDSANAEYHFDWNVVDTTQINPATYLPLSKADFLNKGILTKIVSYPPNRVTRISGFFFFHE
jgi:hypothetical protein